MNGPEKVCQSVRLLQRIEMSAGFDTQKEEDSESFHKDESHTDISTIVKDGFTRTLL